MSSYWIHSTLDVFQKFNKLDENLECDVTIVGGGLTGISCAYLLSKAGLDVVLLEKDFILSKTSR